MSLPQLSVDKAFMQARSFTKKGDVDSARNIYKLILTSFPKNIRAQKALELLNLENTSCTDNVISQNILDQLILLYNQGKFLELITETEKLIEIYPKAFIVWNINGVANKALGRLNNAFTAFKKTISLNSNFPEVYINLGALFKRQGKFEEAMNSYKKALLIRPNYAEVFFNMAIIYKAQDNFAEAIKCYEKALSIKPDYADAYINLGIIMKEKNQFENALQNFKKVLSLNPNNIEAIYNIGLLKKENGDFEGALEKYKKVLSLKPDYAEAYNNIGNIFKENGDYESAINYYNQALTIKPNFFLALINLGAVLKKIGKHDKAIKVFQKVMSFKPNSSLAAYNIGNIYKEKGERKSAINFFERAILLKDDLNFIEFIRSKKLHEQAHICDWEGIENDRNFISTLGTNKQSIVPFTLFSLEDSPESHKKRSEIYAKNRFSQAPLLFEPKVNKNQKRIRIGYFSSDFREHPVAYLLAKVIEKHNRDEFEIFGYSIHKSQNDVLQKKLSKSFDIYRDVSQMNDKEVALLARKDEIDIAIDLNGYTQNARTRIFAYRAAPVQINFLGFPGTMGANFIDYIIADQNLIPESSQKFFNEKPIYLPNTYMPTDNSRDISKKPFGRKQMGLPEDSFVFCCFNNNYKITSEEFDIWMNLLAKIENSVLWLRKSNEWSEDNFIKEAKKRDVDPSRLIFAGRMAMEEHLARHKLADLFLDTFNFNAHTTATEALWSGLPVVTKIGRGFAARVAASLLNAIDLPELITDTKQNYEELILELATNPPKLLKIRNKLLKNRLSKPLFNTELYTKHLENGYRIAYENHIQGKKPEIINVIN